VSLAAESLRSAVIQRAGERCEYCLLTSRFQVGGFELDHIVPVSRGGPTILDNLAFACPVCNGCKLNHVDGLDSVTAEVLPLFNPRTQNWHDHFQWSVDSPFEITGKTSSGRATVQRLALNDSEMLRLRTLYAELGFDCTKTEFE
jgi:hypothetical protein